jgi:hypothetical protein
MRLEIKLSLLGKHVVSGAPYLDSVAHSNFTSSEESTRRDRSRCRRRRFPTDYRAPPPPNSSPPALLRPSRPDRRPPGEFLVLVDPFLCLFPRCSAAHIWSPAGAHRRAVAVLAPWPAWPLRWTPGPPVSDRGSNRPRYKITACLILIPGISEKC